MSIRLTFGIVLAPLAAVFATVPAQAQDTAYGPVDEREASPAQQAINPNRASRTRERPSECDDPDPDPDTIVVCREWEDGERYMFDSPVEADIGVTGSGVPRAPDVFGMPPCSSYTVCVGGLGSVPPPAIMVDFAELPETPPDSDAARLYGGPTADDTLADDAEPNP
jgi:hypothetical protein